MRSMNDGQSPRHFIQRCRDLRLPCWQFDDRGRIVEEEVDIGSTDAWLIPQLLEQAKHTAKTLMAMPDPQPVEICDGCYLLPFIHQQASRRTGLTLVMAVTTHGVHSNDSDRIYTDSDHSAGLCRSVLAKYAAGSTFDLDQLQQVLSWSHEDLASSERDEKAIAGFSENLAHSYEELSLLYNVGHLMNRLTDPNLFLDTACKQLLEHLPFGWVAIGFSDKNQVLTDLANRSKISGQAPCDPIKFSQHMQHLLAAMDKDSWNPILPQNMTGLPQITKSEVIAHPITHGGEVIGAVVAGNKTGNDPEVSSVELKMIVAATDFFGVFHENAARHDEQRALFLGTLQALTASIDAKDRYTFGHSERVGLLGSQLALEAGLGDEIAERYRIAGLIHDVGKIGVPEAVLTKPGHLSASEFAQIKNHPVIGHRILKDIPTLSDVLPGVLYHHERWDGQGYPKGLAGQDIPLIGRILCVADTYDAMSSNRSYRPALPHKQVLAEFDKCAGTQFDSQIANLMSKIDIESYNKMHARHIHHSDLAA